MKIILHAKESVRVTSDFETKNFVDVESLEQELGMAIDLYPRFHYIEIRNKDGQSRMFFFVHKSDKKYHNYGWWSDAEVVYTVNDTNK